MPVSSSNNRSALYRDGGALGILLCALLLLYFPVVFGSKVMFSTDTLYFNFPMYHYLHQAYHDGFIPFWNPNQFAGLPFMAVLQTAVFYPPSLIFFLDDFTLAFNLNLVFHHGVLVAGTYILTRFWGFSPVAALCSSLTALLGGFFLSISTFSNHFHSAAWFPLFFFCFEKFLRYKSTRYFLLSIGTCSLQTLAGSPEYSILSTLLIFSHTLVIRRETSRVLENVFLLGLVVLGALAITAFQLLPTWLFARESIRDFGMEYVHHARWSMDPSALMHLLFATPATQPQLLPSQGSPGYLNSIYMGIVPASCLAGALCLLKFDRLIRFWWIAFWVGIFFALGKFNPLYPFFFDWTPLLHKFRYPEKFFFISAFSLTALAGAGVDFLLKAGTAEPARFKKFLWILLTLLAVGGVLYGVYPETKSIYPLLLLALFSLSGGLLLWKRIAPPVFGGIALLIILIDLMTHNQSLMSFADRKYFDEAPPVVAVLAQDQDKMNFRIFSQFNLFKSPQHPSSLSQFTVTLLDYQDMKNLLDKSIGTIYGLQTVAGNLGAETKDQGIYNHIFVRAALQKQLRILERFNVKQVITADQWQTAPDGSLVHPTALVSEIDALPRAFLVPAAQVGDRRLIPETYFSSEFNPRERVLISKSLTTETTPDFQGEVLRIKYLPNRVEIQTRQNGSGFLILLDAYYPGWKAAVDGKEVAVLRGNHFFRTLPMSEGNHRVVFYYEQEGFGTGLIITGITLLLLISGCVWNRFAAHKKKRPSRGNAFF